MQASLRIPPHHHGRQTRYVLPSIVQVVFANERVRTVVVVTLHPVYSPDTLPFRSLTFSSDNDTVTIGRSSKSQSKNLVPQHNNGWFESRVMSRNHALLGVSLQKEVRLTNFHNISIMI